MKDVLSQIDTENIFLALIIQTHLISCSLGVLSKQNAENVYQWISFIIDCHGWFKSMRAKFIIYKDEGKIGE